MQITDPKLIVQSLLQNANISNKDGKVTMSPIVNGEV